MTSGSYIKSEEHRKNISLSRKGMKFSDAHRLALSLAHKGKTFKHTPETIEKIRQSNLGQTRTKEHKAKLKITRAKQIMRPKTLEERRALSEARKGDKWYTWKGGITSINKTIRNSLEYKLWREAVFKRDNWTCVIGGKEHGNKLEADHIKPFAYYPELRFDINNGRTLCIECHKKTDTYGPKCKK